MTRCLITGASRGIGRAIAIRLADPGRKLLLHGRDQEALVSVFSEVEDIGGESEIIVADLSKDEGVNKLLKAVGTDPVDTLINNAGFAIVKPLSEMTTDDLQMMIAVNLTAPFRLIKELSPSMPAGSSIVNILSIAARKGFPGGWSGYCASKFALEGFLQSIREDLKTHGIRIINIYPAATATSLWDKIEGAWTKEMMLPASEVAEAVAYSLSRESSVLVDNITLSSTTGDY